MTPETYRIARAAAGRWRGDAIPRSITVTRGAHRACLPEAVKCIYIAEYRDGRVAYVGQTRQELQQRLVQHARRSDRRSAWVRVWMVPMLEDAPQGALDRAERAIIAKLAPVENIAHRKTGD